MKLKRVKSVETFSNFSSSSQTKKENLRYKRHLAAFIQDDNEPVTLMDQEDTSQGGVRIHAKQEDETKV